jgi:hypothetical protein
MPWSQSFRDSLESTSKINEYALVFVPGGVNSLLPQGTTIQDGGEVIKLTDAKVTIDNCQITPQRWSMNFGGFTIEIMGDIRPIKNSVFKKGALAELYILRNKQHQERIAIGQLRSIKGKRGVWTLVFGDFISALVNRFTSQENKLNFYYNTGERATVTNTFTFSSSPNLYVDDVTIFEKDSTGEGMVKVSRGGTIGYYKYDLILITSSPAGYLRITDTHPWPASAATPSLQIGDSVTNVAFLADSPNKILAKTIMSTGFESQGSFDTFPKSWGTGLTFKPDIIDFLNMGYWNTVLQPSTGTYEFGLIVEEPQASGIRYLTSKMLQAGIWPVFRQNSISFRCCQDPNNAHSNTFTKTINDRDIIEVLSHEIYSPSASNVYRQTRIKTITASFVDITHSITQSSVESLPIADNIERDMQLIYKGGGGTPQQMAYRDRDRLKQWDFYPWEELIISVTERFATLVAGDIVEITSDFLYGFSEAVGKTYSGRRGMILGCRWQPDLSRCILRIGIVRI